MAIGTIGGMIAASVAGGAVSALGSRNAAKTQASAANRAADAQLKATRETNAMLRDFRGEDIQRFDPFYRAGTNALAQYQDGIAKPFNFDFQADPGYQFRMQTGMDAVQGSVAARQGLNSGAAMKELTRFGQDFGSNEFGNAFNRQYGMYNDRLNRLGQLASGGQAAAGMQANTSQNVAGQMGQNMMAGGQAIADGFANVGNARAAGTVGMGNAFTGAINNAIGTWQYGQALDAFRSQQTPAQPAYGGYSTGVPVAAGGSAMNPFRIGMPMGGR